MHVGRLGSKLPYALAILGALASFGVSKVQAANHDDQHRCHHDNCPAPFASAEPTVQASPPPAPATQATITGTNQPAADPSSSPDGPAPTPNGQVYGVTTGGFLDSAPSVVIETPQTPLALASVRPAIPASASSAMPPGGGVVVAALAGLALVAAACIALAVGLR